MKKLFAMVLAIVILLFCATFAFSHSGRTDSAGGHYDRSTGFYHYHHGYPAHKHTMGICPYTANHSSSSNTSHDKPYNSSQSITNESDTTFKYQSIRDKINEKIASEKTQKETQERRNNSRYASLYKKLGLLEDDSSGNTLVDESRRVNQIASNPKAELARRQKIKERTNARIELAEKTPITVREKFSAWSRQHKSDALKSTVNDQQK